MLGLLLVKHLESRFVLVFMIVYIKFVSEWWSKNVIDWRNEVCRIFLTRIVERSVVSDVYC